MGINEKTFTAAATSGLVAERLDIGLRLPLARMWMFDRNDEGFALSVYRDFLERLNPLGNFGENGTKHSFEDYEQEFETLCDSLAAIGFDSTKGSVPIGLHGFAVNGAHRLAAASLLGLDVDFSHSNDEGAVYDYKFLGDIGVTSANVDLAVLEISRVVPKVRMLLLFDLKQPLEARIIAHLRSKRLAFGFTRLSLDKSCQEKLVFETYRLNNWFETGMVEKLAMERFSDDNGSVCFVLVDGRKIEDFQVFKQELRDRFLGVSFPRRIHGTDGEQDTQHLAELVFSRGGKEFLQTPVPSLESPLGILASLPNGLAQGVNSLEVISGSTILELHGIREARDLDFVAADSSRSFQRVADDHSDYMNGSPFSLNRLLFDQSLSFIYGGRRFLNLRTVATSKLFIGGEKNIRDLEGIVVGGVKPQEKATKARTAAWRRRLKIASAAEQILAKMPFPVQITIRKVYRRLRRLVTLVTH